MGGGEEKGQAIGQRKEGREAEGRKKRRTVQIFVMVDGVQGVTAGCVTEQGK